MIDDFRLWGSRRCRHIHAPPNKTRRRVQVARAFNNRNAFLSEGEALAGVVGDFPETPHQTLDNTDFPRLLRKGEARLRLACPPLARRSGAPHERGCWW